MDPYTTVLKYDVGYREFLQGKWKPTKLVPGAQFTWSEQSIAEASTLDVLESDILLVTYPKSGEGVTHVRLSRKGSIGAQCVLS